jgi:hypothetical protein
MRQRDEGFFLKLVLLTLVIGGSLVISLVYGRGALLTAVPVLLGGALLILVPYLVLVGLDRIINHFRK